ncbi:MAG: SDR family NAD(P)-dependent oxidoreductase [Dethiobacteria bacterium]|jgi:3-oxoacyl-[acyl-carrier protein] reductase
MLKGKVALVTGAAQGMGRGIALALARKGADLITSDLQSNSTNMEETIELIEKYGRQCCAIYANVGDKTEVEQMVAKALGKCGKIDVLVNNAGIDRGNLFKNIVEKDWDALLQVNVKGVFFCTQSIAKHMVQRNYGKIINIASLYGRVGAVGETTYSTTKAAMLGFTKSVAKELARNNINVNAILPGIVNTPLLEGLPEKFLRPMIEQVPLGRIAEPEDIGNVAAFLASDEASYMTGVLVEVTGGWQM